MSNSYDKRKINKKIKKRSVNYKRQRYRSSNTSKEDATCKTTIRLDHIKFKSEGSQIPSKYTENLLKIVRESTETRGIKNTSILHKKRRQNTGKRRSR